MDGCCLERGHRFGHVGSTPEVGAVGGSPPAGVDRYGAGPPRTVEIVGSSGYTGGSEIVLDLDCSLAAASQSEQQQAPQETQATQEDVQEGQEESALLQEANPDESGAVN